MVARERFTETVVADGRINEEGEQLGTLTVDILQRFHVGTLILTTAGQRSFLVPLTTVRPRKALARGPKNMQNPPHQLLIIIIVDVEPIRLTRWK